MMRRLLTAAALAAAVTPAVPAHAAYCGPLVDEAARHLPGPAQPAYWKICGP